MSARKAALSVLSAILDKQMDLDRALDAHGVGLTPQDRSLTHMMVATTLRHLRHIDHWINARIQRPPHPQTRHLLRLGMTQLLFLETADHAAISETVSLTPKGQDKFVNAILRQIQRDTDVILSEKLDFPANLPTWLFKQWVKDYGGREAMVMAEASAKQADLYVTYRLDGRNERLAGTPDFTSGEYWAQDPSSALPVQMMEEALGDLRGKTIIDACAAPGGKTLQLAAKGATIVSVDRSEKRLKRLKENVKKFDFEVEIICADLLEFQPSKTPDAVLLDAPCSATGTIRRHPDLPWIKRPEDLDKLTSLQSRMLNHVAGWGCPILYATCSLQKAEGEHQIEKFLNKHKTHTLKSEQRILPDDNDGFYISLLT